MSCIFFYCFIKLLLCFHFKLSYVYEKQPKYQEDDEEEGSDESGDFVKVIIHLEVEHALEHKVDDKYSAYWTEGEHQDTYDDDYADSAHLISIQCLNIIAFHLNVEVLQTICFVLEVEDSVVEPL